MLVQRCLMSERNDKLAPSEGFLMGHIQCLEGILSTGVKSVSTIPHRNLVGRRYETIATDGTEAARVGDEASMQ